MKTHLSIIGIFSLLFALFVSGCSSIIVRPAIDKVKTVALVSVYMNRDFYDVISPRSTIDLGIFKNLDKAADTQSRGYEILVNYGIKAYSERIDGLGNMKWIPLTAVLSNDRYRKFADAYTNKGSSGSLLQKATNISESEWYTAQNMVHIPTDSVVQIGKVIYIGNKDPRRALAKLCEDLNVDAVAILEFDMAYRKLVTGADIFSGIPAIPSVSSALVVVNRDGEVAVNSGLITKGQGRRFEGRSVGMLQQNNVRLDDKSIASYEMAIDKSAEDMKQQFSKAFKK